MFIDSIYLFQSSDFIRQSQPVKQNTSVYIIPAPCHNYFSINSITSGIFSTVIWYKRSEGSRKPNTMEVIGLSSGETFGLNVGVEQFKDKDAVGIIGTERLTNKISAYVGVSADGDQISNKAGIQLHW